MLKIYILENRVLESSAGIILNFRIKYFFSQASNYAINTNLNSPMINVGNFKKKRCRNGNGNHYTKRPNALRENSITFEGNFVNERFYEEVDVIRAKKHLAGCQNTIAITERNYAFE